MTDVTCAIIRNDEGLVLAVRRGPGMSNEGKWEFPGGKIRAGEDHEDCIIREIDEELGISIIITGRLDAVEHDYGNKQIRLIPFICETLSSKPVLREHDNYMWVAPGELAGLDLTPPDITVAEQYALQNEVTLLRQPDIPETVIAAEAGEEMANLLSRISSVTEITMIAHSAAGDPGLISQLVTLSSSHERRVGFMASWALSKVADKNMELLFPYLPALIDDLPGVANESVQRSFMRVIMKSEISQVPASHHAKLIEYCLGIMRTEDAPVAPKAYGMEILASLCSIYPDLVNEVTVAVQMAVVNSSPGMKAAARKVIARLQSMEQGDRLR
jgi:8-oxo-dGTP diphosphatase